MRYLDLHTVLPSNKSKEVLVRLTKQEEASYLGSLELISLSLACAGTSIPRKEKNLGGIS